MATTYTWRITGIDCIPQQDTNENVVSVVYWMCQADYMNGSYTTSVERNTRIKFESSNSFIPYNQLNQSEVLDWVHQQVLVPATKTTPAITIKEATEAELQNKINLQFTPQSIELPLPW